MRRVRDRIYYLGVVITFCSMDGLANSFLGNGSTFWAIVWLVVGIAMVLQGYVK